MIRSREELLLAATLLFGKTEEELQKIAEARGRKKWCASLACGPDFCSQFENCDVGRKQYEARKRLEK